MIEEDEEIFAPFIPEHSQETIYRILWIKKYDEAIELDYTKDKASRVAHIEAIQWTIPTWRRQYETVRNLFNRQGWE